MEVGVPNRWEVRVYLIDEMLEYMIDDSSALTHPNEMVHEAQIDVVDWVKQ